MGHVKEKYSFNEESGDGDTYFTPVQLRGTCKEHNSQQLMVNGLTVGVHSARM